MLRITEKTTIRGGIKIIIYKHSGGTKYSDLFRRTVKTPTKYIAVANGKFSRSCDKQAEAIKQLLKQFKGKTLLEIIDTTNEQNILNNLL